MKNKLTLEQLFRKTTRISHKISKEKLRHLNIYPGQPPILFMLNRHDGLSQKELIEFREVRPATITRSIQRMEKAGFVEKRWDEQDNRVSRIYLTQKGKEKIDALRQIDEAINEKIFQGFNEKEKEELKDYLERMINNMEKVEDEKTHLNKNEE